mmetsp:Transcript_30285/g.70423  ORF Transcript_30285/g.70423 Transcript_30285/m.70423 type:complete len:471 (+) Transcript_30285:107-1519(+)
MNAVLCFAIAALASLAAVDCTSPSVHRAGVDAAGYVSLEPGSGRTRVQAFPESAQAGHPSSKHVRATHGGFEAWPEPRASVVRRGVAAKGVVPLLLEGARQQGGEAGHMSQSEAHGTERDTVDDDKISVKIGPSNKNKKCVMRRGVVCSGNAGNPGERVNKDEGSETFHILMFGTFVCAERADAKAGWSIDLEIHCAQAQPVYVGQSRRNRKCIQRTGVDCDRNSGNKGVRMNQDHWNNEAFRVTRRNGKVCVKRTDTNTGWDMELALRCVKARQPSVATPTAVVSAESIPELPHLPQLQLPQPKSVKVSLPKISGKNSTPQIASGFGTAFGLAFGTAFGAGFGAGFGASLRARLEGSGAHLAAATYAAGSDASTTSTTTVTTTTGKEGSKGKADSGKKRWWHIVLLIAAPVFLLLSLVGFCCWYRGGSEMSPLPIMQGPTTNVPGEEEEEMMQSSSTSSAKDDDASART